MIFTGASRRGEVARHRRRNRIPWPLEWPRRPDPGCYKTGSDVIARRVPRRSRRCRGMTRPRREPYRHARHRRGAHRRPHLGACGPCATVLWEACPRMRHARACTGSACGGGGSVSTTTPGDGALVALVGPTAWTTHPGAIAIASPSARTERNSIVSPYRIGRRASDSLQGTANPTCRRSGQPCDCLLGPAGELTSCPCPRTSSSRRSARSRR
jgi:hypothetical protein